VLELFVYFLPHHCYHLLPQAFLKVEVGICLKKGTVKGAMCKI